MEELELDLMPTEELENTEISGPEMDEELSPDEAAASLAFATKLSEDMFMPEMPQEEMMEEEPSDEPMEIEEEPEPEVEEEEPEEEGKELEIFEQKATEVADKVAKEISQKYELKMAENEKKSHAMIEQVRKEIKSIINETES